MIMTGTHKNKVMQTFDEDETEYDRIKIRTGS
jgi:hypothetical protein